MGREIRKVPKNWQHPTYAEGDHIPLHDGNLKVLQEEWDEGQAQWALGMRRSWTKDGPKYISKDKGEAPFSFFDWSGERPLEDNYMPQWPERECTHLMMYETCSEGTPISPAFETPEELARWLTDNDANAFGDQTASYESWLRVARGGYAPSAVSIGGGPLISGVEGFEKP